MHLNAPVEASESGGPQVLFKVPWVPQRVGGRGGASLPFSLGEHRPPRVKARVFAPVPPGPRG